MVSHEPLSMPREIDPWAVVDPVYSSPYCPWCGKGESHDRIACENEHRSDLAEKAEIETYIRKPKRDLYQYDGWTHIEPGDYVMVPDDDGDVLTGHRTTERQISPTTVRLWIDPAASPEDVLRVIGKLTEWYRRAPHSFAELHVPF